MKKSVLLALFIFISIAFLFPYSASAEEEGDDLNYTLSFGLSFGPVVDMFNNIAWMLRSQNPGLYNLASGLPAMDGGAPVVDWNGGGTTDQRGEVKQEATNTVGLDIAFDIKFRFLTYLFFRLGVRSAPLVSGGDYEVSYYLPDQSLDGNTTYNTTVPMNIKGTLTGFQITVPFQLGIYIPTGFGGGIYAGAGPAIFFGSINWSLEVSGDTNNIAELFNGDTKGELEFSDFGLGASYCVGFEQEIFIDGLMLFCNLSYDQYFSRNTESKLAGYLTDTTGKYGVETLMLKEFSRQNGRFSYYPAGRTDAGNTDLTYRWAPNLGGWHVLLGIQYAIPLMD